MKIRKGDTVLLTAGKDKNKKGKVIQILSGENKLIIEGINIVKKHVRPKRSGEKGQRVEVPRPLSLSNVKLVCPKCKKSTRVGYNIASKGREKRIRTCKKCGQEI